MTAYYGWADGFDNDVHISILSSSFILGVAVGSFTGGVLMQIGRRRALLIACAVGMTGVLLTLYIKSYSDIKIKMLIKLH